MSDDFQLRRSPARDARVVDRRDGAPMFVLERGAGRGRRVVVRYVEVPSDTCGLTPDDRAWVALRRLAVAAIAGGAVQLRDVAAVALRLCGVPVPEIADRLGLCRRAAEKRLRRAGALFGCAA